MVELREQRQAETVGDPGGIKKEPSETDHMRIARYREKKRARKGRTSARRGSIMPTKLAQTSAFVPRRHGLNTDSTFEQVYVVDGHSVIEVKGRQLGSQHRDVLYAIFNAQARRYEIDNEKFDPAIPVGLTNPRKVVVLEAEFTWRDLLKTMGRTAHVNNISSALVLMEEIRQVQFRVFQGKQDDYMEAKRRGRLVEGRGFSDNLLGKIAWESTQLDDRVVVRYGDWVKQMFEIKHLISLNADIYYKLKSDYAKSIWPFIDSTGARRIDENVIAELTDRRPFEETAKQRSKFREDCRQAFDDMVRVGGIKEWSEEHYGRGRLKVRRYIIVPSRSQGQQGDLFDNCLPEVVMK